MCGIAGEIKLRAVDGMVEAATWRDRMARRGPDDAQLWSTDPRATLVFRRLAILDPTAASQQPMTSADERFVLVYNGELYNFRELRHELEAEGVRFRTRGDTEVVLALLALHGPAALARMNGMFALALYDRRDGSALLARDHVGIKPLYYLLTDDGLVFASQYDLLLSHPWARGLAVSQEALALYLRLGYIPAPWAFLERTSLLAPGSWLRVAKSGDVEAGTYFSFPRHCQADLQGEEAYEEVVAAVNAAVQRQLVTDVPLGVFLSGGIDSPLVAAEAAGRCGSGERRPAELPAFTLGVDGSDGSLDESSDASAYAAELGLRHHLKRFSQDHALALVDDVVAACGEPFADDSIFPMLLLSRLASSHVKVALTGDGGDELFWGYVGRFGSILRSADDFRQPRWYRSARRAATRYLGIGASHGNLRRPSLGDWYEAKHTRLPQPWLGRILPELPAFPEAFKAFAYHGWQHDETAAWLRWNELTTHLTMVLLKVDRASMFHSLEARVPLLDRQVIDVASRVDWRSCLDLERCLGKLPLRHALARKVKHANTAKRGFSVPMGEWLRGPLRASFEEEVIARSDLLGLPLRQEALRKIFAMHVAGTHDFGRGLWVLLSLALWSRHYLR